MQAVIQHHVTYQCASSYSTVRNSKHVITYVDVVLVLVVASALLHLHTTCGSSTHSQRDMCRASKRIPCDSRSDWGCVCAHVHVCISRKNDERHSTARAPCIDENGAEKIHRMVIEHDSKQSRLDRTFTRVIVVLMWCGQCVRATWCDCSSAMSCVRVNA